MKNKLGNFIKAYRVKKDYSLRKFADRSGISHTHVDSIERGTDPRTGKPVNITTETIERLAFAMNIDPSYLFNLSIDYEGVEKNEGVKVPIFEEKQLSIPLNVVEEVLNYEELTSELANTGTFFALKIHDKSMEPKLLEEDIVIIRQQNTVENGEIAVVLVNGKKASIKQIIKQDNGIILNGFNSSLYPPVFYTNQQIEELPITILGKVIESRRKF